MAFDNAVITNEGLKIFKDALQTRQISISHAEGGAAAVPAAALPAQSAVTPPGISLPVRNVEINEKGISVNIRIVSAGRSEGITLRQIGVFARDSIGRRALFALLQDDHGLRIPGEADDPEYVLNFTVRIPVTNLRNAKFTLEPGIFATVGDLDEAVKKMSDAHFGKLSSAGRLSDLSVLPLLEIVSELGADIGDAFSFAYRASATENPWPGRDGVGQIISRGGGSLAIMAFEGSGESNPNSNGSGVAYRAIRAGRQDTGWMYMPFSQ